jgi:hypothetical protein
MISIYLDDHRTPIEHPGNKEWFVVRDYNEFIQIVLENGLENIEIISLDHDLDKSSTDHYFEHVKKNYEIDYSKIKEKTGLDVVKWLVQHSKETGKKIPQCYIHSHNPIGAGNMLGYLNLYLKNSRMTENCTLKRWAYKNG